MKIAIVSEPYVPVPPIKYGGTELVIFNLIKGLKEEGHEPILIGPGDSKVDCEVIPTVEKSVFFPRNPKDVPEFKKQISDIHKNTEKIISRVAPMVDVIHSHEFDLKNFSNFPNLTTLHGPINFDNLQYFQDRMNLNYMSISRNQQEALPELNFIGVAYNGESPDDFPIVKNPKDYVCFLGRFDREKNPHMAINLAINFGIKIKIAGKIDFLGDAYFEEEIKPLLKNPLVEYLGELEFKEKVELLSNAKCNIHPTGFREPFGLTVLEAAYSGTPTLAIARGSMPELIQPGKTGMLVEDFIEGYHHLEDCFNLDREYIAKRSRKKFNYQNMTKSYLIAYRKVLKRND